MSGRHVAKRVRRTWRRRTLAVAAVAGVTVSLFATTPAPAAAPTQGHAAPPTQTLRSETATAPTTVVRDPVTATSQAALDAARAAGARAAAARAAAIAVAAEAHQAATAALAEAGDSRVLFAPPAPSRSGQAIVEYAAQYVGVVPYSTGALPAAGFECDGLTQWVYAAFGVHLPRGVNAQAAHGYPITRAQAQPGDLVVYPGEHIGIYDGRGGIIDSPDWGRKVSHRPLWGNPTFIRIP